MQWFSAKDHDTAQVHVHHGGVIASGDFGFEFTTPDGKRINGTVQYDNGDRSEKTQQWNVDASGDVLGFDVVMERVVTSESADVHIELPVPEAGQVLTDGWGTSFAGGSITVSRLESRMEEGKRTVEVRYDVDFATDPALPEGVTEMELRSFSPETTGLTCTSQGRWGEVTCKLEFASWPKTLELFFLSSPKKWRALRQRMQFRDLRIGPYTSQTPASPL